MSTPYPILDISRTPSIPFVRVVRVELRKAFDTLASFWLMVSIAVIVIIGEGIVLVIGLANQSSDHVAFTFFSTPMAYVVQPALAVMTVMLVTSEWGQRTAMVTFALEARRPRVIYAKLVAALLLALIVVVLLLVVATLCTAILQVGNPDHTDWDFGPGDFVGLLLTEVIAVVLGYALATLVLNTPFAALAFPAIMYALPFGYVIIGAFSSGFFAFTQWINVLTAQTPLLVWQLDSGKEWGRLLVSLLVFVVVPLAVGQVRVMRAEVK